MVMQSQVTSLQQQQLALTQEADELRRRASALDEDNRDLQTQLAQSQQETRVIGEQLSAVRDELTTTTQQLARARDDARRVENKTQMLLSSQKTNVGATITANSSLRDSLPTISIPGIEVRRDRDVVRIELPASKLFYAGGARLLPDAGGVIDAAVVEIQRAYPDHLIGIEGHTDNHPVAAAGWKSNHQLSVGWSMAVHEYILAQNRLKPEQFFVVGHGGNHPIVSNATPSGRERNRRVELVIYPETAGG
ncbi:MAG: OmpA family protein [Planctomycetales bacterium]|nr:OmpA family protein [Planctomycetales bacterium]